MRWAELLFNRDINNGNNNAFAGHGILFNLIIK